MYSTVIDRHPTVITHPLLQPLSSSVPSNASKALSANMIPSPQNELEALSPGAYSIPVKIQGGALNDPTLSGYESPNFIHKKEKVIPSANPAFNQNVAVTLQQAGAQDLQDLTHELDACHNKQEKIETCKI
jgi:hypothetical protein